ncbi:MAG: hypothetical protein ACOYMG_12985 [Candidatus Methylumidiphilus sp.]
MLLFANARLITAVRIMQYLAKQPEIRSLLFVVNGDQIASEDVLSYFQNGRIPVSVVRHNNIGSEFGGYQRAADVLTSAGAKKVLILNDTVGSHQFVDAHYLRDFVRCFAADKSGIVFVGRVVQSSDIISLGNFSSKSWVQSHIFGIDKGALGLIDNKIYYPEVSDLIRDSTSVEDFFHPEIGSYLKAHLTHWLFGFGEGTWYNARPLTSESVHLLANRARAILQEMSLSMRLEKKQSIILNMDVFQRRDIPTRARCWIWSKSGYLFL